MNRDSSHAALPDAPTRARYSVLALIAIATMINYLDRTLLSVAAPSMAKDLGIGPATMGVVFSVFSWSYALAQIPGGVLLDRFGTRITYGLSLIGWSIFTVLQGTVTSLSTLLAVRFGLGAAEAPCFPANSRVLVTWFPQRERARANSVYSVGMYFGIAFLSPVLFWISANFGWRWLFIIVGGIGVAYGLIWFRKYREPSEHPKVNDAELKLIDADGGHTGTQASVPFRWSNITYLFSKRQILGASIGQFATNSTLVFFLTWFPSYLAVERQMSWLRVGFYAVLPFIAASLGVLFGGQLSDYLVRRTGSVTLGRKLPIVSGLLLSSCILAAIYLDNNVLIITVLSIAFFGQGMSNLGWTLISEVAPTRLVGLTGGVFNFCTNLAGIVTPIVIGVMVQRTGSFLGGLAYIGVTALVGALSYTFLVGKVERLPNPPEQNLQPSS
jgi:MFS transporter, ACS family, D-galactonate transporter